MAPAAVGRAVKKDLNLGKYGKRSLEFLLEAVPIERTSTVGMGPLLITSWSNTPAVRTPSYIHGELSLPFMMRR